MTSRPRAIPAQLKEIYLALGEDELEDDEVLWQIYKKE